MEEFTSNSVQAMFSGLYEREVFGEVMLVGWNYVEHIVNLLFIEEKGFSPLNLTEEARTKLIESKGFKKKRDLIKKYLDDGVFEKTEKFRELRNKLFHNSLFNQQEYYSPVGRKELMNTAKEAFFGVYEAYKKKHDNFSSVIM
jgi:hypothetical protein